MLIANIVIYIISFIAIWYGAGLIIASITKFSTRLKLSPFTFSFVFLGILTSIPEFSVGLQAVVNGDPEIFVGNLLGGVVALFLLVIPLLAIFGKGISLKHELNKKTFARRSISYVITGTFYS
ncbi:MAG: putative calcium/sodium:proton antiporter [Microgenomates bacterium OLB23]|nr:MAG: putative calcium/sodium:proton antiporter [Microgenomates bacterium OLB23]